MRTQESIVETFDPASGKSIVKEASS
jgi:hypothetical protein